MRLIEVDEEFETSGCACICKLDGDVQGSRLVLLQPNICLVDQKLPGHFDVALSQRSVERMPPIVRGTVRVRPIAQQFDHLLHVAVVGP